MAEKNFQDKLLPVMVIALIGAAFALGVMWGKVQVYEKGGVGTIPSGQQQAQAPEAPPELTDEQWQSILVDPAYAFGEADAPVTVVEFTDYQCPFCKRYVDDTLSQIKEKYVNTGKVKYIVRDLPLSFHPGAKPSAMAARCAGAQGKYGEMHDLLFSNQDAWANGDMEASFAKYATQLNLNMGAFSKCVTDKTYESAVDSDSTLASSVGASGTPTFFVNGKRLVGAQPFATFEATIEEALQ